MICQLCLSKIAVTSLHVVGALFHHFGLVDLGVPMGDYLSYTIEIQKEITLSLGPAVKKLYLEEHKRYICALRVVQIQRMGERVW